MTAPPPFDANRILAEGRRWWEGRPPEARRRLMIGGAIGAGILLGVGLLLSRNPFTVVYANLSASDAGAITQVLQSDKIPYELQGTTILVPSSEADQVRVNLAEQGLPSQGTVGYSNVLKNMSLGETSQEFNLAVLDALQSDLATTIDSIQGVKSSTVQIVMPQPSVFLDQSTQGAQAAVFVDLEPGVTLSGRQVLGIQELVAHSVQGLKVADVSVTDQNGDPLTSSSGQADPTTVSGQTAITQNFDTTLDKEIASLLTPIVGPGNAVVQTSATMDFSKTRTTSTTYQPLSNGNGVPVSNETITETFSGTGTPPSVSSGTGSSSVPTYPGGAAGQNKLNYKDQTLNYAVSKVNQTVTSQPYTVTGLTVSVVLNSRVYHLTPANKQALTGVIATAIGETKSAKAASAITIVAQPFQKVPVPTFPSSSGLPIPEIAGAAVAGLALAFFLLRRSKKKPAAKWTPLEPTAAPRAQPASAPSGGAAPVPDVYEAYLDKAGEEMKSRPEDMAQMIRTWLREDARDKMRPRS